MASTRVTFRFYLYFMRDDGGRRRVETILTRSVQHGKRFTTGSTVKYLAAAKKQALKENADFGEPFAIPFLGTHVTVVGDQEALCDVCGEHHLGEVLTRTDCGRLVHTSYVGGQITNCHDAHIQTCTDCEE